MKENKFKNLVDIFWVATKLGLTSFGGPQAHLGYFHAEYVKKRKWIDDKSYADLMALAQFLPGPSSSQVGIGVGSARGGVLGGIMAFLGFTWPSALILTLFAHFAQSLDASTHTWLNGLRIVSLAIVLHAALGMATKLTPDKKTKAIALGALVTLLVWPTRFTQVIILTVAGILGLICFKTPLHVEGKNTAFNVSKTFGTTCLALFFMLLIALPLITAHLDQQWLNLFNPIFRSGALVFGGGHVVLPLLEAEFVPTGLMASDVFLAGFGLTQAMPGPLFTFAAYIGTVMNGILGALIGIGAIFLPGILLLYGCLPFWDALRRNALIKRALMGLNAAVVGTLLAAFYQPIWMHSIFNPVDFALFALLFALLAYWKLPPWIVVVAGAIGGFLIGMF
ncbi:MAG: chromate efflux transporter [Defluviitaleaceae bacterium]|nr:chromate efflux transporter [Defluviitaleaceae bacterium]